MKKVLVVDDNINIISSLIELLMPYKVAVETVTSGEGAVELIKEETFDLVITDLAMPHGDGLFVMDKMRKELGLKTPIILLSAYISEETPDNLKEYDVLEFIPKPIEADIFKKHFDALFERQ